MSDQLLMFGEETSQPLTSSLLVLLAKTLASLESVKGWKENDQALSLKQYGLSTNADHELLCGKMLKEHSPAMMAKTLRQSSKPLPTLGAIDLNGNCLIHRGFQERPQNRERIYLVGYSTKTKRNWRGVFPIGEGSNKYIKFKGHNLRANTICARYFASTRNGSYISECQQPTQEIKVKSATSKGYEVATEGDSINLSQPNSETRRGRVGKGKAQTLETSCNQAAVQDYRIRRLTPIECERLQGFPDNHTEYGNYDGEVKKMSNTQRYKQCGNAVTVDVVQAVAEQLKPIYNA